MKKLIFAAVLAIVAIGGAASSVSAVTYYTAGGAQTLQCNGGSTSCAVRIAGRTVYSINAPAGQQGDPVPSSEYSLESFN